MSNEYEQQPSQTEQGLGYDGDPQEEPSKKSSSGLIRAGIFGVILFLAVVGMSSVVNNWFRGGLTDVDEKLAVIDAKTEVNDGISPYKKLQKSWIDTRALLEIEVQNKRVLAASVVDLDKQIEVAKQNVVKAENAVTVAENSVTNAQNQLAVIVDKISDLEDATPQEAFEDAQLAASEASEDADLAQEEFQRAKAEQVRIEATVTELRRAVAAAEAVANASRLLVSAADAAKQAVTENQNVMADADGPAMTNLENNFFADAEQQATNMERSAQAARQAVDVAELRLASLKREEEKFQKLSADANARELQTKESLAKMEKEVEAHLLQMQNLQKENEAAQARLASTEKLAEEKKVALADATREVAVLEGKLDTTKDAVKKADNTLSMVQAVSKTIGSCHKPAPCPLSVSWSARQTLRRSNCQRTATVSINRLRQALPLWHWRKTVGSN